jgi:hypothetical protein
MTHIDVLIDDNDDELLLVFSLLFFFVWMIWHDTNLTLHSRRPKREKKKKNKRETKQTEESWAVSKEGVKRNEKTKQQHNQK